MSMKVIPVFILFFILAVDAAKRNAQCDNVCQGKMTIECCECIGCNQGMRFGKRSVQYIIPDEIEDEFELLHDNLESENAIRQIVSRLMNRSRDSNNKLFA